MGFNLGDISPLAGMVTGKGAFGKLMASGLGGVLGTSIARDAQKANEFEEEQKRMAADAAATKDSSTKMAKGGSVSASKRADGIAQRGKTRGKMR